MSRRLPYDPTREARDVEESVNTGPERIITMSRHSNGGDTALQVNETSQVPSPLISTGQNRMETRQYTLSQSSSHDSNLFKSDSVGASSSNTTYSSSAVEAAKTRQRGRRGRPSNEETATVTHAVRPSNTPARPKPDTSRSTSSRFKSSGFNAAFFTKIRRDQAGRGVSDGMGCKDGNPGTGDLHDNTTPIITPIRHAVRSIGRSDSTPAVTHSSEDELELERQIITDVKSAKARQALNEAKSPVSTTPQSSFAYETPNSSRKRVASFSSSKKRTWKAAKAAARSPAQPSKKVASKRTQHSQLRSRGSKSQDQRKQNDSTIWAHIGAVPPKMYDGKKPMSDLDENNLIQAAQHRERAEAYEEYMRMFGLLDIERDMLQGAPLVASSLADGAPDVQTFLAERLF